MSGKEGKQMYCTSCGSKLPEGVRFCGVCGSPVGTAAQTKTAAASGPRPQPTAPAVPAPRPYQPAPAAVSARPENPKKWPVSAGVLAVIALLLSIIRPALMIAIMTNMYGSGNFSVNLSSYDVNVAAALLLAILLLVHTRKIPWLTAIPRSAGVLLSLVSVVRSVGYYGAPLAPYMIFGTYLPLLISLVVLVLYWVFTLRKKAPTAFAVTVLVLAILGCLINLINLGTEAFSRAMPPHVLVDRLLGAVIGIITEIAYVIALFALRGRPEPRVAPQRYGMPGYNGQPVRSGYDPPAYAPQPPAAQPVYDAPSGGYAALGFFFPVVGLILYLVWKDQTPLRARSAGKGALIGVIVGVVLSILLTIVSVAINASILASLY